MVALYHEDAAPFESGRCVGRGGNGKGEKGNAALSRLGRRDRPPRLARTATFPARPPAQHARVTTPTVSPGSCSVPLRNSGSCSAPLRNSETELGSVMKPLAFIAQWDWAPALVPVCAVTGFVVIPAVVVAWWSLAKTRLGANAQNGQSAPGVRRTSPVMTFICIIATVVFVLWLVAAIGLYAAPHSPAPP